MTTMMMMMTTKPSRMTMTARVTQPLGLDRSQRFFVRTSRISAKAMKMAVTTMMRRRRTTTTMMTAPITPTVMTNFDTSG